MFKMNPETMIDTDDVTAAYLDSFTFDRNFENRCFKKFCSQTMRNIMDYIRYSCPNLTYDDGIDGGRRGAFTFHDFVKDLSSLMLSCYVPLEVQLKLHQEVGDDSKPSEEAEKQIKSLSRRNRFDDSRRGTFLALFNVYGMEVPSFDESAARLAYHFLWGDVPKKCSFLSADSLVDYELAEVCKDYLKREASLNSKVRKDNIMNFVPQTPDELLPILMRTLNRFFIDTERLANSLVSKASFSTYKEDKVAVLLDRSKKLEAREKAAKEEAAKLRIRLSVAQQEAEANKQKNIDELEDLRKKCDDLSRDLEKKKMRLLEVEEKYNNLKEQMDEQEKVEEDDVPEVDISNYSFDGRYLFMVFDDCTFIPDLRAAFPNAVFSADNVNLGQYDLDLIIVLTRHVKHQSYLPIKKQAKTKGIPLIHSYSSNVDMLKRLIASTLKEK